MVPGYAARKQRLSEPSGSALGSAKSAKAHFILRGEKHRDVRRERQASMDHRPGVSGRLPAPIAGLDGASSAPVGCLPLNYVYFQGRKDGFQGPRARRTTVRPDRWRRQTNSKGPAENRHRSCSQAMKRPGNPSGTNQRTSIHTIIRNVKIPIQGDLLSRKKPVFRRNLACLYS